MTFLEEKLLDLFRACDDTRKFAILETAKLCLDLSKNPPADDPELPPASADPSDVQTSIRHNPEVMKHQETRSIEKIAKRADGQVPLRYALTLSDCYILHDMLLDDKTGLSAFGMAFDFGFVMGNRATRRGKVKAL